MSNGENYGQKADFKFYLVLKGEIVIFTDREHRCLRLFAPDLPVHAYMAGPWLAGAHIPKHRKLILQNVQHGTSTPADHDDILFILPNPKPHPELSYFEIVVPFPKEILPGAVQDASGMHVTITSDDGTTNVFPTPKTMCVTAILVYGWDGKNKPVLKDRDSARTWSCGGKLPLYRSLHVCAAGETKEEEIDTEHARTAFHRAAGLLGASAEIDSGQGGDVSPTFPPPGLSFLETNLSYFETLELGQALGEILEGGNGVIPSTSVVTALGGNCGPIGG
jgi:hypothetical protein